MSRHRTIRNKGVIAAARVQRAPAPGRRLPFRSDPWTRKLLRPLLITLLATSVAIGLLVIVRISTPELAWMSIVPLSFLAALEGAYTTAWLNNPDSNGVDRLTYRAAEVLLLLVVARVYSWVALGAGIPSPEQMQVFLTSPMTILSVGGFVTTAFVSLVAWWLAVTMSRIFSKLDVSVYEINFYTLSPAEQKAKADDRPIQISRDELQAQFLNTWLMVGMLMVFMAALSTFEVGQLTSVTNPFEITRLGMTPAMLFALMTYFLTGFWLLSHARLLRMNARWLADGVAKEASLERGWQRSAFVVVGIIALIAAFLPIGSTLAISHILTMGLAGLGYVASTIFFFFGNLFASMLMLLTQNAEEGIQQPSEALPPATVTPPSLPPADSNPLLSMIISSAFWALVIAFIIASLLFFLRERGYRLDNTRVHSYWVITKSWLHEFWRRLSRRANTFRRDLQDRLKAAGAASSPQIGLKVARPRFLRLSALTPREQIRYYYLALVRRAGENGIDRRDSETPLEYIQDLKKAWPEADIDFETMTDAFLEARYSPQPIEKHKANAIKQRWNSLRTSLRKRI